MPLCLNCQNGRSNQELADVFSNVAEYLPVDDRHSLVATSRATRWGAQCSQGDPTTRCIECQMGASKNSLCNSVSEEICSQTIMRPLADFLGDHVFRFPVPDAQGPISSKQQVFIEGSRFTIFTGDSYEPHLYIDHIHEVQGGLKIKQLAEQIAKFELARTILHQPLLQLQVGHSYSPEMNYLSAGYISHPTDRASKLLNKTGLTPYGQNLSNKLLEATSQIREYYEGCTGHPFFLHIDGPHFRVVKPMFHQTEDVVHCYICLSLWNPTTTPAVREDYHKREQTCRKTPDRLLGLHLDPNP